MNRRESILAMLAVSAGGHPLAVRAQAQPAGRPFRIGLVPDFQLDWFLKHLTDSLAEFGRVEGRDYIYIRSGVFYGPETQKALERVLEAKPDLMLTGNLGYAVAAHKVTKTIPIVMWVSGFPVEGGVAESLTRPGGNVTGLTIYAGGEVFGKLVQLVHEVKPDIKRIGALMSYVPPFNPRAEADLIIRGMRDAAQSLGVDLRVHEIAKPEHVDDALAAVARGGVEALVLTTGVSIEPRKKDILRFAVERRLPTIADAYWEGEPLLEYRVVFEALLRQAAPYVNKILWQGAKPGELPIQLPARFTFSINQKMAKAIAVTLPRSILARADEVIE